ncbi:hypothetical protein ACRAWD_30410 [Caulobacter segnis]
MAELAASQAALRQAAEQLEIKVAERTRELQAEVESRSEAEAALHGRARRWKPSVN